MKITISIFMLLVSAWALDVKAQNTPNDDPKNPTGCISQLLGGNGSGSIHSYRCIQCGATPGCPSNPNCPFCWEVSEINHNGNDLKHIRVFQPNGPTLNYIGDNVQFVPVYIDGNNVGIRINFDVIEELKPEDPE